MRENEPIGGTEGGIPYRVAAGLSLVGVVLVLVSTSRYGAGVSPDSASYLAAAKSLLAGQGYRYFDGRIYTQWPPLFPTLLAFFNLAGMAPLTGARLLNGLAFGLLIFVSARIFARCRISKLFAILGTLSIVLSAPLLAVSIMAWSEPVFILLAALFVLLIPDFLRDKRLTSLLLVSLLAGAACLQRYAGVSLVVAGVILIAAACSQTSLLRRFGHVAAFGVLSVAPLALWLLRNQIRAGETTGGHHLHPFAGLALLRIFPVTLDVMAPWFFPHRLPAAAGRAGVSLILLGTAALLLMGRRRGAGRGDRKTLQIGSVLVVAVTYLSFLAVCGAGLSWTPEDRLLAPAYPFVLILVFAALDRGAGLLGRVPNRDVWARPAMAVLCILWLFYPLQRVYGRVKHYVREGPGEYSTAAWQRSPLMGWLRSQHLQGDIYSNVPDAVYLLTGRVARETPHYYQDATEFARKMSSGTTNYVVWSVMYRDFLYDLPELALKWRMTEVAAFPDGRVYRFLGAGGPDIAGVYRFWSRTTGRHLYTLKPHTDPQVLAPAGAWAYEGLAFHVFGEGQQPAMARPVHQFWSDALASRFYTIDDGEKRKLLENYANIWRYEGVAWYAYPEGQQTPDAEPVYRFWSRASGAHFYTALAEEKDRLMNGRSQNWACEGIAWYGPVNRPPQQVPQPGGDIDSGHERD